MTVYIAHVTPVDGTLTPSVETVVPVKSGHPVVSITNNSDSGSQIFVRADGTTAILGSGPAVAPGETIELKVTAHGIRPQVSLISTGLQPYRVAFKTRFSSNAAQTRIPQRPSIDWAVENPVLDNGQVGFDETLRQFRLGDGIHHWLELPAVGSTSGGGTDADSLGGHNPSFYLDRNNHTGTQSVSTITGLGSAATAATSAFDAAGTATTAVTNHSAASDPHGDRAYAVATVNAAIAALAGSAPAVLDTLNEIAQALADDPNLSATLTALIATKAADTAVVHNTLNETVAGVKTFSSPPVVPSPVGATDAANRGYVDGLTYTNEMAQDTVGGALTDSTTVDFTYNDGAGTITAAAKYQKSVTADSAGLQLSGDTASPGVTQYYGTDGTGTKGFYGLPSPSGPTFTSEDAQDAVGAALTDTNTVDFTYNDAAAQITADAKTQLSVTSDSSGLKLSGDTASPGINRYYGTDGTGSKGFYSLPVATIDTTGHATGTEELYWDETTASVKLRKPNPTTSLATKLDIRAAQYGGRVDGKLVAAATTSSTSATTVSFAAAHNIVNGDIGKSGWVLDSTGNGTIRTISAIPTSTSITLSGQCGRQVTAGQFVYGTLIDTAAAAALADAATYTTVDTTAGVNKPWGPASATEVYIGGGTGIALLSSSLHVQAGTRLNQDGITYCNGQTTTPYVVLDSNTSIGRLTLDVGPGRGVRWGNTTGSQAHCSWERIEIWGRGSITGRHLIELQGLDYQGNEIWTKGGDTAVRCVSGTDSNLGHMFTIGAVTGLAISQGSQITGKQFSDSCTASLRIWGGADNVHIDIQAFMTSASSTGTTKMVVFGTKDDGTTSTSLNQNIRLQVQARDLGETVVDLNYCQNVTVRGQISPRLSGGAITQSHRGTMTGIRYGTSVGDGIDVDLSFPSFTQTLDDNTTPAYSLYSGTPTGQYMAKFDDKFVYVTGAPYRMTGGTPTNPTLTAIT